MVISKDEAFLLIQKRPYSFIFANIKGEIHEVVGMDNFPSSELLQSMWSQFKDCGMQCVIRGKVTSSEDIERIVSGIVEALQYSEKNPLKAGINIPPSGKSKS